MADGILSGLVRRAADVGEDLAERAEDVRDRGEAYRRKGYRKARRYADDGYQRVRGYADDGYDRARDYADDGYRRVRGAVGSIDARRELRRLWDQLEDVVENRVAPAASSYARQAGRYSRDAAVDAASYVRDAARARPLMAIGIAVAATWVVASLMRSGRDSGRR